MRKRTEEDLARIADYLITKRNFSLREVGRLFVRAKVNTKWKRKENWCPRSVETLLVKNNLRLPFEKLHESFLDILTDPNLKNTRNKAKMIVEITITHLNAIKEYKYKKDEN